MSLLTAIFISVFNTWLLIIIIIIILGRQYTDYAQGVGELEQQIVH